MARYTGPITRSRAAWASTSSDSTRPTRRVPTRPASTAAAGRRRASTASSCTRSRRRGTPTASSRSSSAATTRRPTAPRARPARRCCRSWSPVSTTSSTAPASARTRRHARQLVVHGHFLVNGHKVDVPSYRVASHDVIDVRPKSLEMTPFIIARETHGERPVPAWLEVLPGQLRILVHQLPVRQQIDTPVQEQLIVELYSK